MPSCEKRANPTKHVGTYIHSPCWAGFQMSGLTRNATDHSLTYAMTSSESIQTRPPPCQASLGEAYIYVHEPTISILTLLYYNTYRPKLYNISHFTI